MATIIKNKKAYDSGDVTATINGVLVNITEITYTTEQEHQLNYTLKNDATSWSRGKKTHSCTIGIMMHDMIDLENAAGGDVLNVPPFDVNVTFENDYNVTVNDTVTVKFQSNGREVNGDMGLQKSYDMFVLGISLNNV